MHHAKHCFKLIMLQMKPLLVDDAQTFIFHGLTGACTEFLIIYNPRQAVILSTTKMAL